MAPAEVIRSARGGRRFGRRGVMCGLALVAVWFGGIAAQPVSVPAGTEFVAELEEDLDTRLIGEEGRFALRLTQTIRVGGRELIPRGARILGLATAEPDEEGHYSTLVLTFREIAVGMRTMPVSLRVKALKPPPPPKEPVPSQGDEPRRRPRIEISGGISIRRIPDPGIPAGKPSKRGMRRESVEAMTISVRESGATEITLPGEDIALRPGTQFHLVLTRDLEIR